ncbi:MAG: hypothetical protein H8E48_06220 [Chloroflexi bacterium]|nr:hypothetical protein [Chloroflexota bacterium]
MKYPEDDPNFDPDQSRREAVSSSGDDLSTWQVHVTGLRDQDTFLNLAMKLTEACVAVASPLVRVFHLLGTPLRLLGYGAPGMLHVFFRLLLAPFFGTVLFTSSIWTNARALRPLLIILGPIFVMLTLWLLAFFPEESEVKEAKSSLCKVWPLSRRRLEWIRGR